ncbi:hypothetical protein LX36DRAFT_13646 [Colletotrichum falcatum]|nr:hypothetical protein LX36DRAFT_13646 [Colletotrichum falcatum]
MPTPLHQARGRIPSSIVLFSARANPNVHKWHPPACLSVILEAVLQASWAHHRRSSINHFFTRPAPHTLHALRIPPVYHPPASRLRTRLLSRCLASASSLSTLAPIQRGNGCTTPSTRHAVRWSLLAQEDQKLTTHLLPRSKSPLHVHESPWPWPMSISPAPNPGTTT